MKILAIYDMAYPYVPGGGQRRLWEVARRLVLAGCCVEWLTFQSWPDSKTISRDGIEYVGVGRMPNVYNARGNRSLLEPLQFLWGLAFNSKKLRQVDLVWVGQWPLVHILPISVFCRVFSIPLVVDWWEVWTLRTWQSYSASIGWLGFALQGVYLRVVSRHATLVADSEVEASRIRGIVGNLSRVVTLWNGVPAGEIGPVDIDAAPEYDVGCLVRLKNHKRVDLILEALKLLRDKHGIRARAAIIGDGPERTNLENQARALNIADQVTFFGHVPESRDAYAILKRSNICLVTATGGGAGSLAVLEGYGCGLPVVSFRSEEGIDPGLIDEGATGLLVEPVGSEPLADALAGVLRDPERIRKMKKFALAKAADLSWERVADNYRMLFREQSEMASPIQKRF